MTIRLPFIDRLKLLSRDFINGKNSALKMPRSYEVEILPMPSLTQRGSLQSPLSNGQVSKPGATVVAPRVRGKTVRRWLVNQQSGRDVEHTRSNLG